MRLESATRLMAKCADASVPKDGQISTTAVPKALGPPSSGAAGTPPPKASSAQPITVQKLLDDMHAVHGDVRLSHSDVKRLMTTLAEVKASVADLSEVPKRLAAIEKLIGVFAVKIGPMGANVDSTQKAVDQGFKENVRLLSTISGNVRGHREDAQQEAKDYHAEQGQWLSATENKLVDGIKEVLKKITNTDFNSSQVYNQKLEGIASEILAALNFTQTEVGDLKTTLSQTSEVVHSIKEMCERPVVSSHPPSYRAPVFQGHHDN
ncbi:NPHP3 [Symbiodinium sp. CCMP2592]|nr:NPHP3 [Symbiodinium sp. CCMP2592]